MNFPIDEIFQRCKPWVDALKKCPRGYMLYRGFKENIDTVREFKHNLQERKPVNTPVEIHDIINSYYDHKFGWKIRNGVFCYGLSSENETPIDLGYGKQYLFFPIGDFDFVYSPEHFDLYEYVSTHTSQVNDLKAIDFRNDTIKNAIEAGDKVDGLSNEISVKTEKYYLLNIALRSSIVKALWT